MLFFLLMEAIVCDEKFYRFYYMKFANDMFFFSIFFAKGNRMTILEGILKTFVELENGKSRIFG